MQLRKGPAKENHFGLHTEDIIQLIMYVSNKTCTVLFKQTKKRKIKATPTAAGWACVDTDGPAQGRAAEVRPSSASSRAPSGCGAKHGRQGALRGRRLQNAELF